MTSSFSFSQSYPMMPLRVVGQLRDQTPDEAIAWRDVFIAEHDHPSTWEMEREQQEDLLE